MEIFGFFPSCKWVKGMMHATKLVKGVGGINELARPLNDYFYPAQVR